MLRRSVVSLALLALAACEFPTEPPKWEQTWVVPGEQLSVSVAELLPTGIDISTDSSAFVTEAPGTSLQFSLAAMCGTTCDPLNGLVAPKPAFSDTLTSVSTLPADLVSATLSGGALSATMAHNFNFDPLRPSSDPANPTGYIVVRVTSNGALVAYDSIDGADATFPEGSSISPNLAIQPVDVTDTLDIEIALVSPAGDPTTIETADTLGVTVAPSTIEIAEATVNAGAITLGQTTTTMNFGGVDSTLVERIQSGALIFDVSNPFSVTGTLDLAFQNIFPTIQGSLTISQGDYEDRLDFTGEELRAILGADAVDVVTSGSVSAAGGTVTVTPTQELTLDNEFELVVLIGPLEDQGGMSF